MKTIMRIAVLGFLMVLPVTILAQGKGKDIQTVRYLTSIDCESCVNKIMTNLPHEKGIKDVKCDLKTKEVTVSFQKDKNNPEEIQKSLEKLGYKAKELKESGEKTTKEAGK